MVKITIPGCKDIKLTEREYNQWMRDAKFGKFIDDYQRKKSEYGEMATALQRMVKWDVGGMYGDGEKFIDKPGLKRAIGTLIKIGYEI